MMEDEDNGREHGWQYLRLPDFDGKVSRKFGIKKNVWVADAKEGFVAAEIKASKGDQLIIVTEEGVERTLHKDDVQQMNPPKYEKIEDIADLTFLNDASVLHNLRQRYYSTLIYTYSGLFCVVINPYRKLPIYTQNICRMYIGKRRNEMPPHIFAICDEAYRSMVNDRENQSMLITGESGAGKTENTKKVISYFAIVGRSPSSLAAKPAIKGSKPVGAASLEEQIVRTNPVLEAFGNAKTVRNNNSSRFGKYIRIHFNSGGRLAGADIEHYLLEKSRVIKQAPGERSYHIFYQMMSEGIKGLRKKLFLESDIRHYRFVSQAEVIIDGVDDKEEMAITDESFDIMKFSETEKFELFSLTAAIMHMDELKFKQRPREEQAEYQDQKEGKLACRLLNVDFTKFLTAMLKPRVKVGTEWVRKGQNLEQVTFAIGALAKALYSRMFHWLIRRCNMTLDAKDLRRDFCIGVLDIAGFEIFDLNSFEQLWINYVNERLQQFFNHHMFVSEQEEYKREGIQWEFIDFGLDLQPCIDLIEKPLGIISMLDEECIVPKATDLTLVQKLNDQHLNKHPNFRKPKSPHDKQAEAHFAIVHYAGTVSYNVRFWLEKNKDPLNDTVVAVLKGSEGHQLLREIWEDYQTQEEFLSANGSSNSFIGNASVPLTAVGTNNMVKAKKKGKSSSFMTVSMMYRESLTKLLRMLNQTHPHFIRCIIPNEQKIPGVIEANLVLNQLTCNGVLEGIRICRKGYPNRVLYEDFRQRYAVLASAESSSGDSAKASVQRMCESLVKSGRLKADQFQCGSTKIFFRSGVLALLEEFRDESVSSAVIKFQQECRFYLAQLNYRLLCEQKTGIKVIQRNVGAWCTLKDWHWWKLLNAAKPFIQHAKNNEQLDDLQKRCKDLEENRARDERTRHDLESAKTSLWAEKRQLLMELEREKEALTESEQRAAKLVALKNEADKQLNELSHRLAEEEDRCIDLAKTRKKLENDNDMLKKTLQDMEIMVRKKDGERQSKDHQIRALQDEIAAHDELITKLSKEKKHEDELNRKLMDELSAETEKHAHLNKAKTKLEYALDQAEDALERERRVYQEVEKQRRKAEGELKIAQENLAEIGRQKAEAENAMKKRDSELNTITSQLEDEQSLVARLQRQIKELLARIQELEEELNAERHARSRAEKSRNEMQAELEELADRLDEAGGATQAQAELNKRREAEMAKLRRDMEETTMQAEISLAALRKKHNDGMAELSDQLDAVHKARTKLEKEKLSLQKELEELQISADTELRQRQSLDRMVKQLETQLMEAQTKCDEQSNQLQELVAWKNRSANEIADLIRQVEDAESQVAALSRVKTQLTQQLVERQAQTEQDARDRQALVLQANNSQLELQQLREALEEEQEVRAETQRQLSKANAEAQQWRARFETETIACADELDEARRHIQAKAQEIQEQLDLANSKITSLEKTRHRLQQELEDAQIDAERANSLAAGLERKQKEFDGIIDEWRRKCNALGAELDASQSDSRAASAEIFRLRSALDETTEQIESVRRENKCLAQELRDMTEQLDEDGRNVHEFQKMRRRLELERDELQQALEDAEAALEAEESKVLRAQVEVTQIRSEIEKRIAEKEEEFENTRKNHQRALESAQATLEMELRGRADLLKTKKKLESDMHELEAALDRAFKANAEAQRNAKRNQETIRDLQQQVDEEQRIRDDMRDQLAAADRRVQQLQLEADALRAAFEQAERARRQMEHDFIDVKDSVKSLSEVNKDLSAAKRKLEADAQLAHTEMNEVASALKDANERARAAAMDANRLADELRAEQEHAQNQDRQRKALCAQLKELQAKLDEAELASSKNGHRTLAKLEARITELEGELDAEVRRHAETHKTLRNKDRRARELQLQVDEDKKSGQKTFELVEKLQLKLKTYKRQAEESDQLASTNLSKYCQLQQVLEDAEERADTAENSLSKIRYRGRSSSIIGAVGGAISSASATALAVAAARPPLLFQSRSSATIGGGVNRISFGPVRIVDSNHQLSGGNLSAISASTISRSGSATATTVLPSRTPRTIDIEEESE